MWLQCRLAGPTQVEVVVPVGGGEVVFAHPDDPLPPGPRARLLADARGRPDAESAGPGAVPLPALALMLDPARPLEWTDALADTLSIENRVDGEAALQELAVHLDACVRRWREVPVTTRRAVEAGLATADPAMASLLQDWPTGRVEGPTGRFPRLAPPVVRSGPEPDDENWEAWRGRDVEGILGERGGLARLLGEQFEPRAGQLDMARAVARTLARREHLMCEAGTGIGKSLGYLVPALLHGARVGKRVVVSTHTHALQTQLVDQDLPLLERLGYPGRFRRLLGRNNYLCRRQMLRALSGRSPDAGAARARFAIALWAETSAEGRREELADHPWFESRWRIHFESIEPCSPHICHRDPVCFVVRARREARDAQVVVVNHALLMMDVRGEQSLVGPAGVLVVDEAHQLPDVATHALSVRVSGSSIRVHENLAGDRDRPGALRAVFARFARRGFEEEAGAADRGLEEFLRAFDAWLGGLEEHFRGRLGTHASRAGQHRIHDSGEAFAPVRDLDARRAETVRSFATALATLLGRTGDPEDEEDELAAEREALARLLEYHDDLAGQVRFVQAVDDEDHVYWVDWGGSSGLRGLVAAPLAVAGPLSRAWDEHYDSVVMTSATLAVEEDFLPFAESVGFDQVQRFTESLLVESPFRAHEQSRIFTSLDLPGHEDPRLPELVADLVVGIARQIPTRMIVLSTSYRFIDQVEPLLRESLAEAPTDLFVPDRLPAPEILVQRPGTPKEALIARYRAAPTAVLLGTGSFWEGVDFPGEQLEVLVVPRLPFSVPTDPVVEGRSERAQRLGRDPFESVSLVDAVLRLKQGVGRLLRSSDDRGVVLLLDQRLQTRDYGVRFVNSLPRLLEILPERADLVSRTVDFLREGRRTRRRSAR